MGTALELTRLAFDDMPTHSVSVALFTGVQNSKELRDKLVAGALEPEVSLINADVVPDLFLLQLAAHKALESERSQRRTTRSLHTELVFNMSGSKHVAESLKRFGISDDTVNVLVARFDAGPEEMQHLTALVDGDAASLDKLPSLTDTELVAKYYKISKEELSIGSLVDAITVRIATRDC